MVNNKIYNVVSKVPCEMLMVFNYIYLVLLYLLKLCTFSSPNQQQPTQSPPSFRPLHSTCNCIAPDYTTKHKNSTFLSKLSWQYIYTNNKLTFSLRNFDMKADIYNLLRYFFNSWTFVDCIFTNMLQVRFGTRFFNCIWLFIVGFCIVHIIAAMRWFIVVVVMFFSTWTMINIAVFAIAAELTARAKIISVCCILHCRNMAWVEASAAYIIETCRMVESISKWVVWRIEIFESVNCTAGGRTRRNIKLRVRKRGQETDWMNAGFGTLVD